MQYVLFYGDYYSIAMASTAVGYCVLKYYSCTAVLVGSCCVLLRIYADTAIRARTVYRVAMQTGWYGWYSCTYCTTAEVAVGIGTYSNI